MPSTSQGPKKGRLSSSKGPRTKLGYDTTLRREGDARLTDASSKKGKCAESPPTFISVKHRKNRKRCGLRKVWKGSGVVFTHGEGISTPRVHHKGWQPLIKCANMTSKCFIFSFFMFLCLFMPFCIFYLFVVDKGVSLAPTYSSIVIRKSDLHSCLRTKRWLSCF